MVLVSAGFMPNDQIDCREHITVLVKYKWLCLNWWKPVHLKLYTTPQNFRGNRVSAPWSASTLNSPNLDVQRSLWTKIHHHCTFSLAQKGTFDNPHLLAARPAASLCFCGPVESSRTGAHQRFSIMEQLCSLSSTYFFFCFLTLSSNYPCIKVTPHSTIDLLIFWL